MSENFNSVKKVIKETPISYIIKS